MDGEKIAGGRAVSGSARVGEWEGGVGSRSVGGGFLPLILLLIVLVWPFVAVMAQFHT